MSDNTNNGFPVPEEPRTREEQYLSAIAGVTEATEIPEKPRTRVEAYLNEIVENGGGSVYDKLEAGTNINIEETSDGKAKISATGEVSSEDTYAREQIADHIADKDNPHEVSAADVGLGNCDNTSDLNKPISTATQTALNLKADKTEIPSVPITAIQKNGTGITPVSGTVNITVPTQASDINAATATQGGKADTAIQGIKVNSSTVNPDANKVVNITVPTSAADVSALPDTTKYAAALSLTINSLTYVMTGQLKDQNGDNLGTAQTIDLPLESVVVGGSYNSQTKKVVLTLQNGNTIEFSVADLVSGLQTELSASNKLNPAYINYDSTHRAVSDTEKSTWNGKQSALTTEQLAAVNSGITSADVAQITTNENNILTLESMNGAKNLAKVASATKTGSGYFFNNAANTLSIAANASVYICFDYDIPNGQVSLQLTADGVITQTSVYTPTTTPATGHKAQKVTTPRAATGYNAYYNGTGTASITNVMIVPADIYEAGFTAYQPYAMSNVELTAAIQALQAQLANQ